jgi:hypothetical protein
MSHEELQAKVDDLRCEVCGNRVSSIHLLVPGEGFSGASATVAVGCVDETCSRFNPGPLMIEVEDLVDRWDYWMDELSRKSWRGDRLLRDLLDYDE